MLQRLVHRSLVLTVALLAAATQLQAGLIFNLNSTGNVNADAGFQAAADFWSGTFNDDVEVNLDIGFASLGGGILGQAGSTRQTVTYDSFRNAVAGDSSSAADATFSAALPGGNSFDVFINRTTEATGTGGETPYVDNDGGANNTTVRMTTANAKALGLRTANNTGRDASITFNSDFSWDFDSSDGVGAGLFDFVGVAIHEIGHAMGFISGVDVLDGNGGGRFNDNAFTYVAPLDFARFSVESEAAGADIDWTADSRKKFYSIDGGTTLGAPGDSHWSTGVAFGDGRQASHWKDGLGLGIMDPTAQPRGRVNIVTDLDIQALDIIGWDEFTHVPEPSAALLLGAASLACWWKRRRTT
jgi:hypothetical protein